MNGERPGETAELLVEIGCEELPAGWLPDLVGGFARHLEAALGNARLGASVVRGLGGPRRLVAHAVSVPVRQPDREETITGPPARIAGGRGAWTRAAAGFARKHGIAPAGLDAALSLVTTPKGEYVAIRRALPGRRASEILPGVLEAALRSLHFPKAMEWDARISGAGFPFGRPIRWIVFVFGGEVVPFSIERPHGEAVVASDRSRGHRFRARDGAGHVERGVPRLPDKPGASFPVRSFAELEAGLERRFVCLDPAERARRLEAAVAGREAEAGASRAGSLPVTELADLVEWPGTVLGRYPETFLALPEEIRHAVLVHHQKYIPLAGAPAFVAVTNLPDDPIGAVRRGSERVVLARLEDAQFFFDEDRRIPLAARRSRLAGVLFHRRLGAFDARAARLERLARRIAPLVEADPAAASEAAGLAKCDLTTGLVGEFASLQGVTGGLLLRDEGAPERVWRAVYDHYRPGGLDGELPGTPEGVAVSLADSADALAGLTLAGEAVSGGGDPFGLRRAAFSVIRLLADAPGATLTPERLLELALEGYDAFGAPERDEALDRLRAFFRDRLLHALSRGGRDAEARAVLAGRTLSLRVADARRRIEALATARDGDDLVALAAAATRVRRILPPPPRDLPPIEPERFAETAETALHDGLLSAGRRVGRAFAGADYAGGIAALARLRPAVDRFFDDVLVMAEDEQVRRNRLALLAALDGLFAEVGDLRELAGRAPA